MANEKKADCLNGIGVVHDCDRGVEGWKLTFVEGIRSRQREVFAPWNLKCSEEVAT